MLEQHDRAVSLRLWLLAGAGAVALHAGCIALAVMSAEQEADDLGAPSIEIGFELASRRAESVDLPIGPEAEASMASPAVEEQKVAVEQSALPRDTPVETETPDRLVTTSEAIKPPQEEPTVEKVEAVASVESPASEAMAAPMVEAAPEAMRTVALAQGIGESARRAKLTWQRELAAHFDRHKRYPASRNNKTAEIVVRFELDRTGRIVSSQVVRSSGDPAFDEAALAMLKRSDPVPAPPPIVADEGLYFALPVIFRVGKS